MTNKIVAVFGPGAFLFGDYYGQIALKALLRAREEQGISFDIVISPTTDKIVQDMQSCCKLKRYNTILAIGNATQEPVAKCAKEFPEQRFALVDGSAEGLANVVSYASDASDISFLCGEVAIMMSRSPIVGCMLWSDSWVAREWIEGFIRGAKETEPAAKVYYSYAKDADEAYQKARLQFGNGVEIIMCHAGASDLGIIRAANDGNKHVLGFLNERQIDPEHVLFDVVRHMDPIIVDAVKRTTSQQFTGGQLIKMGLKHGSFGLDLENTHERIGEAEKKRIDDMISMIRSGNLDSKLAPINKKSSLVEIGGIQV
jgi:basic membrane protein A